MKKSSIMMLALSGTMLVGCTQSEYIGEAPQQNGNEIVFSGASGKMTRATSNTGSVAEMLDKQIKFYGVKKTGTTYANVFEDYVLWFDNANKTTSNPDGDWEYVDVAGHDYGTTTTAGETKKDQFIKYWDFATDEYHFVAGSPVKAFTYALEGGEIKTATVTGIAGHLNPNNGDAINTDPIYIAAPVKVANANYKKDVVFSFTRQQSFVRVGVFETIPGYEITDIKFYSYGTDAWTTTSSNNITLASVTPNYFTGATNATATLTYEWGTPSYTFEYTDKSTMTQQNNWFGGALKGVPATTSTEATVANLYGTDGDMAADNGYFTVIPTATATIAAPLLVKCDYTLMGLDGNDIINVKGATAAIPAAYTKWAPNTSYTYLFKISDNTNGTTGEDGPEGLFPITFDAAVVEVVDGTAQGGTVTTVSTPSITVYQNGNVVKNGITYVAGDVVVKAMVGTTEVTPTWSYVELDGTTYDYTKDYEKLGTNGAATTWTSGALTSVTANKTYVIKAVYNDGDKDYTAYFVLVVGAAEEGPANS